MGIRLRLLTCVLLSVGFLSAEAYAQSGKISGRVTEAASGAPLPGVNVVIDGTTQGTSTDIDGYYTILNVQPGTYDVRASFIGFAPQIVRGVEVNLDLTTTVNIQMQEEAIGLDEVVVEASEPIVRPDISASVANMNSEDMENMPIASLDDMIGLQAGIQGLSVRGGNVSSLSFIVDGASQFDARSHQPFTGVSFTSIEQVQVQTGGFNAEYGNVRSGLVNVVTKDGPRNRYIADVILRYSPADKNYFGPPPSDAIDYWMRPYLDPEVAFEGTANWDKQTQLQYPSWSGWNEWAEQAKKDDNPDNDLTPEQWQDVFRWYYRKDFDIKSPDFQVDGSVGGPVPGIGRALGNLRFLASYRQTQNAYLIPQIRDAHQDYLGRLRLTADVGPGMKLEAFGMRNQELAHSASNSGDPIYFTGQPGSRDMIDRMIKHVRGYELFVFGDHGWSLQDVNRYQGGLAFTHSVSPKTFYQVHLDKTDNFYYAYKGPERSNEIVHTIGTLGLNEAPMGFDWNPTERAPTAMRLGGLFSSSEDSSWSKTWSGRFNMTSQLNRYSEMKAGVDYMYTQHKRLSRATTTGSPSLNQQWRRNTEKGAAFVQNKLEFEGLIANVGLRLDYYQGVGDWYDFSLFEEAFAGSKEGVPLSELLSTEDIDAHVTLSPRLGVSFPITANSKLFFNYGHFREMLEPDNIFRLKFVGVLDQGSQQAGTVSTIGNPNHPMPRTVAYELGYEQNLFNQFLVRMTGYYKDLSAQTRNVSFVGDGGNVNYSTALPYNYEDIRGLEASLTRITGHIRGFVNYTYMARKGGFYGFGTYFQNPIERLEYIRDFRNRESTPVPQPYARFNLSILAPDSFGPEIAGVNPLADWRFSILGDWRSGRADTWCGGGGSCPAAVRNNVRWKDFYNLDLRLSKVFNTNAGQMMVFVDMSNALNIKRLNQGAFMGINEDERHYMQSLRLEKDVFEDMSPAPYRFIPGNDRPGDYRDYDVQFIPIEIVQSLDNIPDASQNALYYHAPGEIEDGTYYRFDPSTNSFNLADESFVDQVLEDKAYIDMPNLRAFWFLHPREVWFGLRLTL